MTDTLDGETKESNKCLLKNQVIFLKNIDSQNRSTADVRLHISCYAFAQHLLCRRRTTDVQQHSNHILKSAPRRRPENSQGCGSLTCEL